MKILVTGGTGFTGSALALRLLEEGHDVKVLDTQRGILFDDLKEAGAEIILGSVTDKEVVKDAVRGTEIVFHLAAAFRELNVPERHYHLVNVEGTRNVMQAALLNKSKKVIYCSTQGVHGDIKDPPGDENSPIAPADYYQQTKYEGEIVVREFIKKGLTATIIRPTAIYGPGDPGRFLMIYKRVKKGMFPMFGSGKTYYHPVYIDNLTQAFILSMKNGNGDGEAYIIGDEIYVEIEMLVRKIAEALHCSVQIPHYPLTPLILAGHVCEKICKPFRINPPIFPRRVDWYRQNRAFKIDKAMRDLNYKPKTSLEEGLKITGEWYLSNGYL